MASSVLAKGKWHMHAGGGAHQRRPPAGGPPAGQRPLATARRAFHLQQRLLISNTPSHASLRTSSMKSVDIHLHAKISGRGLLDVCSTLYCTPEMYASVTALKVCLLKKSTT